MGSNKVIIALLVVIALALAAIALNTRPKTYENPMEGWTPKRPASATKGPTQD